MISSDTTTSTTKSVSAVIISHADKEQVLGMVKQLNEQTKPPDEFILCVCCMEIGDIEADIKLLDIHRDDVGQSKCDMGLRLATKDYVGFFSSDDYYEPNYIEELMKHDTDIVYCDFWSRVYNNTIGANPVVGQITRGCYLVRREFAVKVGYNGREYHSDGTFIEDLVKAGASEHRVPAVLYKHL